ncbi:hypothetical protein CY34DRAFT_15222 [Suillus luteus UH-Slu-Lm8-n1]|uniref:Protein-S-isoprenylcysteine O-methyltransferase n=1 Tax=Suillus luteus UH-Slu-Lm8-n1 TaxID=930992 RepID=A0A0D0B2I3_9AGAM|nr:hypothetical protein CY34DRAFT_15222 [Suillus luteus UH-Slu-Lm8-n1]
MSLLKIPLIIASAIGIHVSFTTSYRPPSSEEKVMPTVLESSFKWLVSFRGLELVVISIWAASAAEVANIITKHIDPLQTPEGFYGASAVQLVRVLHSTPITPAFLAGSLTTVVGGVVRLCCMSTLGKLWSFQLSIRKEHRLMTSGPYSIVRHPSYTAFLLQYIGFIVMYGSPGSWMRQSGILQVPFMKAIAAITFVVFTACALLVSTRPAVEDEMMHHAMGEEWESWAKKVNYRLLPGIY